LYFKSLFSDKGLIYDDLNIQIGYIRQVSLEWRQAIIKLYINNKNDNK